MKSKNTEQKPSPFMSFPWRPSLLWAACYLVQLRFNKLQIKPKKLKRMIDYEYET